MSVFPVVAMLAYLLSLALIIPSIIRKNGAYRRLALISVIAALICHAVALQQRIFDVSTGQNLSLVNIGSVVSLIICTVMTIVASRNRGWFILPIVYSFALINLAFVTFLPGEFITHLEQSKGLLVHIGLALFAYATLIIAALYALQLAWLDYQLKNKRLTFNNDMPPLMTIERKLFHITQVGVILLTLTLCTGLAGMRPSRAAICITRDRAARVTPICLARAVTEFPTLKLPFSKMSAISAPGCAGLYILIVPPSGSPGNRPAPHQPR